MDILKTLLGLCEIDSISGNENSINEFLKDKLKEYSQDIEITPLKSVVCKINKIKNNKKILLEAHLDSVGLVVESITEEGFLKIAPCGGIDPKMLISNEVLIISKEKIKGIIFIDKENLDEKITLNNLLIDINMPKEKTEKIVSVGDPIVFKYNPILLKNNRVSVRYLDNRASIATIFLVLEKLKEKNLNCEILIIFSSQEETTQIGVKTAINSNKPDVAISIDVSFAKSFNCDENLIVEMGKGPLIGVAPILDNNLRKNLIKIAKEKKIPYQLEIMNSKTHTNADEIAFDKDGVKTSLISIPIKNMHTPIEMVELKDIENTADLIYNFIISYEKVQNK